MAALSQTWFVLSAVTLLLLQLCAGENSCVIWSTAGSVVQRGSSFKVYSSFKCECKGKGVMCSDHPATGQGHQVLNSTTIYFNVVNISMSRTYSCQCDCPRAPDSCGMDIYTGYPPDRPDNISCIHKVQSHESQIMFCTWNPGRDTYLASNSVLHVKTHSENGTFGPKAFDVSTKGYNSASFPVSSSVQQITVSITAQNVLGSVTSSPVIYTLSNIAMPSAPVIGQLECSSRACTIRVRQSVRTQHLEIQYSSREQAWLTSYKDTGLQMSLVQDQSVSSLEPYRSYHFRARSKFSGGLWSAWSRNVSSCTQEEAPAQELDVWFARPAFDVKSLRVYWKEENISMARGRITGYKVSVHRQKTELIFSANISADVRNYLVPFCAHCEVKVWSCNAKGPSPSTSVPAHHRQDEPLEVRLETMSNHSVAIYWKKTTTTHQHATAYVVEWFPEGYMLEELRWIRLGTNDSHALITEIEPCECYEGAVYVVYNDSSVSRTKFKGVTTLKSVPGAVPSILETVNGNKVEVSWMEVPRGQRGGCITRYTIHLESNNGDRQDFSIPASKRTYTIKDLPQATYRLWVTASTDIGEGPVGPRSEVKFFIQQEMPLLVLFVIVSIFLILLPFVCLCQTSAGKRRLKMLLKCLMLDEIPDPANSKWAKECTKEKGKIILQLQPSNSIVTQEEEEPIMVDIEELPEQTDIGTTADVGPHLRPQTSTTEQDVLLYPPTTYIKSFSHDSNSSNHTQTSLDTNVTVDYISSHGLGYLDEEDQEEEEDEEEFGDTMDFYPSQNIVIDPMLFRGKVTLDTVKIDCGNLFH